MLENKLHLYFTNLLNATIAKTESWRHNDNKISEEYWHLEQVPPAPGNPSFAHDMMVKKGKHIVRHKTLNSTVLKCPLK